MDRYLGQAADKLAMIDSTGSFHEDSVVALLVLFREHLEANNLQSRYRTTCLYSNWSMHSRLDRRGTVQPTLQEISDILSDPNERNWNDRISDALSLRRLRAEMIEMLDAVGGESRLFRTYAGWKAFVSVLLKSLIEKPLQQAIGARSGRFASSLTLGHADLRELDQGYITEFQMRQDTVFWRVVVSPVGYTLTGPLVLTELPEDFDGM